MDLENKETSSPISEDNIGPNVKVVLFNNLNHFLQVARRRRLHPTSEMKPAIVSNISGGNI